MEAHQRRLYSRLLVLAFCSSIVGPVPQVIAANPAKTNVPDERLLEFKGEKSLGALFLAMGVDRTSVFNFRSLGDAKGKLRVVVPSHLILVFEPSMLVLSNPKLLSQMNGDGIDVVSMQQVMELDESEKGKCDRFLKELAAHCKNLRQLIIDSSDVTDDGIASLAACQRLESLSASRCTSIKGKCLPVLAQMPSLRCLGLRGVHLSDEYLKHLPLLTKITYLNLRGTGISASGA